MATINGVKVVLNRSEVMFGASVGSARMTNAIFKERKDTNGADKRGDGWTYHIDGANGEQAAAIWLGVPWNPKPEYKYGQPDLEFYGLFIEVRTRSEHEYDLPFRPKRDVGDLVLCLVTGKNNVFLVRGFVLASVARTAAVEKDFGWGPGLYVEQEHLILPHIWFENMTGEKNPNCYPKTTGVGDARL